MVLSSIYWIDKGIPRKLRKMCICILGWKLLLYILIANSVVIQNQIPGSRMFDKLKYMCDLITGDRNQSEPSGPN